MNEALELMARMWSEITSPRDEEGDLIEFNLSKGKNQYIYWEHKEWMFCYTPWKSTKSWYYAFTYQPKGSGKNKVWKMRDRVKFRKRKQAKKRAYDRYTKRRTL